MPAPPLHLLFVAVDLHGGAGVYVKLLATGLKRYADRPVHIALLLFRKPELTDEDRLLFDSVTTLDLPVHTDWRRSFETVRDIRRLGDALNALPADITVTIGTYANLLVPYVAEQRPTILTEHVHVSGRLARSKSRIVLPKLIRWRYPGKTIVVPSEAVAEDLREQFGLDDVRVIPHGVDADRIRRLAEQPVEVPARAYLVAVGRLSSEKDYPTLLTAFAEAIGRGINTDLIIVGNGPQLAPLQELTGKLGISQNVHFKGYLENPYPYIKHARMLVLSSIYEGFGLVLLEAMTLGCPVISTRCLGGPAEILGDGQFGKLVPMRDPHALADAMLELMSLPDCRKKLAALGLQRANELGLAAMASQYFALFDEKRTHPPTESV